MAINALLYNCKVRRSRNAVSGAAMFAADRRQCVRDLGWAAQPTAELPDCSCLVEIRLPPADAMKRRPPMQRRARWRPHRLLSAAERQNRKWLIADLRGAAAVPGPLRVVGKPTAIP